MKLSNQFEVAVPVEQVWETLLDVERIGAFLPGATVRAGAEEDTFEGTMKMKLGPMVVSYTGSARLGEVDEDARSANLHIQAREARGQGTAAAVIHNRLEPVNGGTRVSVETELQITGRQAQFGRGIMDDVAGRMLDQFAQRFETYLLQGDGAPARALGAAGAATGDDGPASAPATDGEALDLGSMLAGTDAVRYGVLAGGALLTVALAIAVRRSRRRGFEFKIDRSW